MNEKARVLAALPDLPTLVETRALLLEPGAVCDVHGWDPLAFVVADDDIASAYGPIEEAALHERLSASGVGELLSFDATAAQSIAARLGSCWSSQAAMVYVRGDATVAPRKPEHATRLLAHDELARVADFASSALLEELSEAIEEGGEIVCAVDASLGLPVAFAYAAWESESYWDMSIDTLDAWRRRGFALSAATALIAERPKTPVWGALETNVGSLRLAEKLGYERSGRLWVLTRTSG